MIQHHENSFFLRKILLLSGPVILLLGGCATEPLVTPSLEQARSSFAIIERNPDIPANAEVAAYEAKKSLQLAEQAEDVQTQEHLSYLAERKSRTAIALAEKAMAEKQAQRLAEEKEQVLLKAREFQIEKAKKELEARKQKLEKAGREAEEARRQAELSEARARKMEAELAELKGKQTDRGVVLTLGDVLFATGRATLMPGAIMTVEKLAEFLQKYPDRKVLIEGHTDSVGKAEYNMFLSQRRADAVRSALIDQGISPERISTKGYGETYPVASNKSAVGRQQNRRVEIVVLNPEANP